ncbi:unnamed protein product [Arctogadus glacialis]
MIYMCGIIVIFLIYVIHMIYLKFVIYVIFFVIYVIFLIYAIFFVIYVIFLIYVTFVICDTTAPQLLITFYSDGVEGKGLLLRFCINPNALGGAQCLVYSIVNQTARFQQQISANINISATDEGELIQHGSVPPDQSEPPLVSANHSPG